jgi:hypothetical protein
LYEGGVGREFSRTQHAGEVVSATEMLRVRFSERAYGTRRKRVLRLSEPESLSTDGGRKARQTIMLADEGAEPRAPALVCGWIDIPKHAAEIRAYAAAKDGYTQRGGPTLDLSHNEYDRAMAELQDFLATVHVSATVVATVASRRPSVAPPPASTTGLLWAVAGLGFVAGFSVCWALVRLGVLGH